MKIGIDFGTCYSFVSALVGKSTISLVHNDYGNYGIPTVFAYQNNKEFFGREAEEIAYANPEYVVSYIKRDVRLYPNRLEPSSQYRYLQTFTARQVIEKILNFLISEAKREYEDGHHGTNSNVEEICVAVPETASVLYKEVIRDCLKNLLKLDDSKIHIILEPVAAAIHYLKETGSNATEVQRILVYDLGGGTFDAAVVKYDPKAKDAFTVEGTSGHTAIGGLDWDEKLSELVQSKTGRIDFVDFPFKSTYAKKIIKAKHELSNEDSAPVSFMNGTKRYIKEIERREFEKATKDLLDGTIASVNKALSNFQKKTGLAIENINKILLVGGSSYMPQVKNRLIKEYGKAVGKDNIILKDPSKAISWGATLYMQERVVTLAPKSYGIRVYTERSQKEYEKAMQAFRNGEFPGATLANECINVLIDGRNHALWEKKGNEYHELCIWNFILKGQEIVDFATAKDEFHPHEYGSRFTSHDIYESEEPRGDGTSALLASKLIKKVSFDYGYTTVKGDGTECTMILDKNGFLKLKITEKRNNKSLEVTETNVFE